MRILLIESFLTGSHRQWAEGYQLHSGHEVELLTHPARLKWGVGMVARVTKHTSSSVEA